MFLLFVTILLCLLPQVRSRDCDERGFKWTGRTVKVIRDCDMLRDRMTIHLNELANKPDCLSYMSVKMGNVSVEWQTPRELLQERRGNKLFFMNPLPFGGERCTSKTVYIKAKVFVPHRQFVTTFALNPQSCAIQEEDVSFERDCYKNGRFVIFAKSSSHRPNPPTTDPPTFSD